MSLEKDATPFMAAGKFLGRAGLKALGKTTKTTGKALWSGGKLVKRRPGMALTGAFAYPWTKGYSDGARRQTLSTMGRRMPKFASEAVMDGFLEKLHKGMDGIF